MVVFYDKNEMGGLTAEQAGRLLLKKSSRADGIDEQISFKSCPKDVKKWLVNEMIEKYLFDLREDLNYYITGTKYREDEPDVTDEYKELVATVQNEMLKAIRLEGWGC